MFPDRNKKSIFDKKFNKLLDSNYWQSVQKNIQDNGIGDYYPYSNKSRMCEIYK
jgi:isocitrate dehydrogenase kinase/phosphatase